VDPDRVELLSAFGEQDRQIEQIGALLLPELEGAGPFGGRVYVESLANALAVHLLRYHSSLGLKDGRGVAREPGGGLSKLALKLATDYVNDNLSGDVALDKIAGAVHMSPYHFSRMFKLSTGLSPHQYVIHRRVEVARGLLAKTNLSLHEVARATGFAHQSHLAHHTRRLLGVSPTALR